MRDHYWEIARAAMFAALIGIGLLLTSCETTTAARHGTKRGYARVTFYNPFETDRVRVKKGRHYAWRYMRWGRRTASGVRAMQGITLAAPKAIPFGTRVVIPKLAPLVGNGTFCVQDRGGGVSRFGQEWLDVFVDNKSTMQRLATMLPEYLEYQIIR